jgi:pyruvate formate-lyase activating enzyme-like uncharacterized protein
MRTKYHSHKLGTLPKGCRLCVKGAKLVLFLTGLCPRSCYYCPISDKKHKKDVIYADEWPVTNIHQIIQEAKLINAKGAGITGGDPLSKEFRTLFIIITLKKHFGKAFHIHLYTSPNLINENILKKLNKAGLDEIRLHLDLDNKKLWKKIKLAKKYKWKVGVEVPAIPKKQKKLKVLIDFLQKIKIDFLNLNELEVADNKVNTLLKKGFTTKDQYSYAVKGSEKLALKLLKYCKGKIKNVHFCTAKLKDSVQLANRIKRRAKNVKKPYDKINKDGTLTRGAVYLEELKPGFGYRKKLQKLGKKKKNLIISKLNKIYRELIKDLKLKRNRIEVDEDNLRLLTGLKEIQDIKHDINRHTFMDWMKHEHLLKSKKELKLAIVTEYPTYDKIILDLKFL